MKSIVLLSGGMDSTTLLYHLLNKGAEVRAIGFNYGQRHVKELMCARLTAIRARVPFEVVDLSVLAHILPGSSQTDPSVDVPEGHYSEDTMKATVVPNRNMILLSIAIGHAVAYKFDAVAYAAHSGDHAVYPDCRPEFADKINELAQTCDWHPVQLLRPFINFSKAAIVKQGTELGVPYQMTWSCYAGKDVHCGRCGTCCERREAFRDAGAEDPTQYLDYDFAWKVLDRHGKK